MAVDEEALSHRHSMIVQMAAAGMLTKDIAVEVKLSQQRVGQVLAEPAIKKRIAEAQEKYWGKAIRKRMESVAKKALDQIEMLIDDPTAKCSTRLAASTYIVDQAVGKAQQNVAIQTTVLGDLIMRIDKMGERAVDQIALDAPRDALDTFVDDLIPETMTVGAKRIEEAGSVSDRAIEALKDASQES